MKFQEVPHFKDVNIPPTQLVSINLCKKLQDRNPYAKYVVILDNLFLTVPVVYVLLKYGIGCLGTTRKKGDSFPSELRDAKDHNRLLQWGEDISIQVGNALCFLWQDNNAVIGITTSFSLHKPEDHVIRSRKRPKKTSTNAAIVRPVFGDLIIKDLPIPTLIDVYNHHMNGIDLANQIRRSFTCQRPHQLKWWRPIAFWLFDICANNSFLIWQRNTNKLELKNRYGHQEFQDSLIRSLLGVESKLPMYDSLSNHVVQSIKQRRYCAWGSRHPTECHAGRDPHRKVLGTVVNGVQPRVRGRQVQTICVACGVALCADRSCFHKWHAHLYRNN